jgi:cytoplasmic iron level regulating protein YaaA (DUF328/UPF0246 family)
VLGAGQARLPPVLILLPPSEGKFGPARGKPLDLDGLSFPGLREARQQVLDALVELCSGSPEVARATLGLPPGLAGEVARNAGLRSAPTTLVSRIYTGVLYDALSLETLSVGAKRRAASRLLVTSSLFGVVRPLDRIPAYRLSGDVTLPGLGTVASTWRQPLADALGAEAEKRLVVDLRSGTYGAFWRPTKDQSRRVVAIRVLQEVAGRRSVVSHFNKATKGRIVRAVLEDGADARTPQAFADLLARLGWQVEPTAGSATSYDVIVTEI